MAKSLNRWTTAAEANGAQSWGPRTVPNLASVLRTISPRAGSLPKGKPEAGPPAHSEAVAGVQAQGDIQLLLKHPHSSPSISTTLLVTEHVGADTEQTRQEERGY